MNYENSEQEPKPKIVGLFADKQMIEQYPHLVTAAQTGISDVLAMMQNPLATQYFGDTIDCSPFSVDELLDESTITSPDRHPQVLHYSLHNLIINCFGPTAESITYLITAKDLTTTNRDGVLYNFILGAKLGDVNIQSINRYLEAGLSPDETAAVVRHIARHEFGHMLGLDEATIANQDGRGLHSPLYAGHCANLCTMQQTASVEEASYLAQTLKDQSNAGFCLDCANYIRTL